MSTKVGGETMLLWKKISLLINVILLVALVLSEFLKVTNDIDIFVHVVLCLSIGVEGINSWILYRETKKTIHLVAVAVSGICVGVALIIVCRCFI